MTKPATILNIIEAAVAREPALANIAPAGEGASARRNRRALEQFAFRPRILRPIKTNEVALGTTLLGVPLSAPLLVAPIGNIEYYHPDGAEAVQRVAAHLGIGHCVGVFSSPSLEDVVANTPGPAVLQLYWLGKSETERLIRRAEEAGYVGICLTGDAPIGGYTDFTRYFPAKQRGFANFDGKPDTEPRDELGWKELAWMRQTTNLPIMLKGVLTVQDTLRAIEHGVDAIYVSNHGGLSLDHTIAPIDVLAEIIDTAGNTEVVVDGGFIRGADVAKALALGAQAVGIGRAVVWGLLADGVDGLTNLLQLLSYELAVTLRLLGVRNPASLSREYIARVPPLGATPETIPGLR